MSLVIWSCLVKIYHSNLISTAANDSVHLKFPSVPTQQCQKPVASWTWNNKKSFENIEKNLKKISLFWWLLWSLWQFILATNATKFCKTERLWRKDITNNKTSFSAVSDVGCRGDALIIELSSFLRIKVLSVSVIEKWRFIWN